MTTYLLAGGGTAGHVNPLLAVADALRAREPDARDPGARHARGPRGAAGARARLRAAVRRQGALPAATRTAPRPRSPRGSAARSRRCARTSASAASTSSSASAGTRRRPRTSRRAARGVPVVVHEANAKPGTGERAGRAPAPRASASRSRARRSSAARVVGMPLRREIVDLDRAALRAEAAAYFGLDAARPTLLVFGGSLGAQRLNEAFGGAWRWRDVLDAGWQLIHVTGERSTLRRPGRAGLRRAPLRRPHGPRVRAVPTSSSRARARPRSARSARSASPPCTCPYAVGNGEQALNAASAVRAGAAILIPDAEFTADRVRVGDRAAARRRAPAGGDDGGRGIRRHPQRTPRTSSR